MSALLETRLSVDYGKRRAVRDVRIEMQAGEILGLAGQSGAGKSTIGMAILGLTGMTGGKASGELLFEGRDLLRMPEKELRGLRGRAISLVPQSPIASLNPALRLETQFHEAWRAHSTVPFRDYKPELLELLRRMSLPAEDSFLRLYPGELSVGLAQRVLIGMAVMHRPALMIADEPTSALDLMAQEEILRLMRELNREFGTAILYISHDLLSIAALCHRVAVLRDGALVECGPVEQIFGAPHESYTRALVSAIPAGLRVF